MPEETETTTPPAEPVAPMSGPESWPAAAREAMAKLNAENASWRTRLREAEPYVAKAKELEEAQKTAEQRATEAQAAAEQRATEAESKLLRLDVAAEKGLTPAQAKRLVGATREELEADADDILATFPALAGKAEPKTPKPDPSQGARPDSDKGGSVAAGASLYQQKHGKKN